MLQIAHYLPKLHTDLQKFAVAFEEMVEDEVESDKKSEVIERALEETQYYLKSLICEVESSINSLPIISLSTRIQRSIMSEKERDPIDHTRRMVRDWGILHKYEAYLHSWKEALNY